MGTVFLLTLAGVVWQRQNVAAVAQSVAFGGALSVATRRAVCVTCCKFSIIISSIYRQLKYRLYTAAYLILSK